MSNNPAQPSAKFLEDYQIPDFLIESVDLDFDLCGDKTKVVTTTKFNRNGEHERPLVLVGNQLQLDAVALNGEALAAEQYEVDSSTLTLHQVPQQFELVTEVTIDPANNKSLEGLYKTDGAYCTQCEAEGFRRITYFLDRPDVLCKYTTKITANKETHPILLSNGNKIDCGDLADGKHWVKWQDPHKKPSYSFCPSCR